MPVINALPGAPMVATQEAAAAEEVPQVRNIVIADREPTESDGQDGDVWMVYDS